MTKILEFNGMTTLDIPAKKVLDGAKHCKDVIVVGRDENGDMHFGSSMGNAAEILWLLEVCKAYIMEAPKC